MKNIIEKYKITIITTIIVLFICVFSLLLFKFIFRNSLIKTIDNDSYYIEYDKNWKLKQKKKENILLKHQSGSKIIIQIDKLSDNYKYSKIDELIDELKYNIKEQNKDYNLISSKDCYITKYKFKGYKILYENNNNQVMVNFYKKGDNLITIRYEANSNYFDILLDSVNNIIYNLNIKDEKFDYKSKIDINTSRIEYDTNEELDKKLKNTNEYEISKNHYLVKYSIPSIFKIKGFDSTLGSYEYKVDSNNNINIDVDIYNLNIYEYLDKENSVNVYKNYNTYRKDDKNKYSNFKEEISILDENKLSYIYKNSYDNNNTKTIKKYNTELIYELDNNHILLIKITSSEQNISKKLIDTIKVIKTKNYASYINNKKEDDMIVSELKKFTDYNYNKYDSIIIKIPNKYEEIDKNNNYYIKRNKIYFHNFEEPEINCSSACNIF